MSSDCEIEHIPMTFPFFPSIWSELNRYFFFSVIVLSRKRDRLLVSRCWKKRNTFLRFFNYDKLFMLRHLLFLFHAEGAAKDVRRSKTVKWVEMGALLSLIFFSKVTINNELFFFLIFSHSQFLSQKQSLGCKQSTHLLVAVRIFAMGTREEWKGEKKWCMNERRIHQKMYSNEWKMMLKNVY